MNSACCLFAHLERCSGKKPCCSFLQFSTACFAALALLMKEKLKTQSRGCLGCCKTSPTVVMMEKSSQGREGKKLTIDGDFWGSSASDININAVHSQRSNSSIRASDQTHNLHGNVGNSNSASEFINHALLLWLKTRQQWVENRTSQSHKQVQESRISWNATYENLLVTNKPFPQPIPLPEMVDFLVDIWEQDGLHD